MTPPGLRWIDFPSPDLEVRGIVGETRPLLHRLSDAYRPTLPPDTWDRTTLASGVRLAFQTDSSRVAVRLEYVKVFRRIFPADVYLDGKYWSSFGNETLQPATCEATVLTDLCGQHAIELHLPPYAEIRFAAVGIDSGAVIGRPDRPPCPLLVFHGDSITHGALASRAASTYPARVARALDADFINLGVGGAARGEPGMAALVADLPADAIVLAFGVNTFFQANESPRAFGAIYGAFLEAIRSRQPDVPLVAITPTHHAPEARWRNPRGARLEEYRQAIRQAVGRRQSGGDAHLLLIEGLGIIGPGDEDRLADGVHPNDEGMAAFSARLVSVLRAALRSRSAVEPHA